MHQHIPSDPIRSMISTQGSVFDKGPVAQFLESCPQFFLRIHDDRAPPVT